MAELLPCPFCGRKPVEITQDVRLNFGKSIEYDIEIECTCGMKFNKSLTRHETTTIYQDMAISVWNTRTPKERG